MIVQLNVTQAMIDSGEITCTSCPVAQSFLEVLEPQHSVEVGDVSFAIGSSPRVPLPDSVRAWIDAYDEGANMHPISFIVDIPWHFLNNRATRDSTIQGSYISFLSEGVTR